MGALRSLVVIPTYNERENLAALFTALLALRPDLDVLVVDDGSPDGTAELAAEWSVRDSRIQLVRRPGKLGIGSAHREGFRYGLGKGYEFVLTMDGDQSHDPAYVPALLAAMDTAHLAIGSRYVPGGSIANWALHRRILSRGANLYTRWVLGLGVRDCTSGFRCYHRSVLEQIDLDRVRASGYAFLEEMAWLTHRSGFAIREVPIRFIDRHRGRSKIDRAEIFKAIAHVSWTGLERLRGKLRSERPRPASEALAVEHSAPLPHRDPPS